VTPDKRSLVIAPQWIGDAIMTEPLLRRLQARGERLTVGALPWVAPVYRAMPQVAEVIEFPFQHGGLQFKARLAIAKRIRGQFDIAYVCPNSLKSALLPAMARIPRRVGYTGEVRIGLLTDRLPNPADKPPMVAFYSALSGETGLDCDRPQLQLASGAVDSVLAELGLARQGFYVLAPGAEYGPAKRWPTRHFADLAAQLGKPVVLLGSGKEAALCDEIVLLAQTGSGASKLPGVPGPSDATGASDAASGPSATSGAPGRGNRPVSRLHNLAGKTTLEQAMALIAASAATISNDSGLMHVAAALGVAQVAIFGSSSPRHTPPLNDRASVLWLKDDPAYQPPLDCAPCFARDCPLGHTRCLNDLDANRVLLSL